MTQSVPPVVAPAETAPVALSINDKAYQDIVSQTLPLYPDLQELVGKFESFRKGAADAKVPLPMLLAQDLVPKLLALVGVQSVQLYQLQAQIGQLQEAIEELEEDAEEARIDGLVEDVSELLDMVEFIVLPSDQEKVSSALTMVTQALESGETEDNIYPIIHPILANLALVTKGMGWTDNEASEDFAAQLADLVEDAEPEEDDEDEE